MSRLLWCLVQWRWIVIFFSSSNVYLWGTRRMERKVSEIHWVVTGFVSYSNSDISVIFISIYTLSSSSSPFHQKQNSKFTLKQYFIGLQTSKTHSKGPKTVQFRFSHYTWIPCVQLKYILCLLLGPNLHIQTSLLIYCTMA